VIDRVGEYIDAGVAEIIPHYKVVAPAFFQEIDEEVLSKF
tara:strand:- start:2706 stop:2825 length:120 start_codon:yes stop_codon:yes gene_type:complete